MHGQFVWYELHTTDVEGARKFYPRFTGWGTQKFDDDYLMWTTGGVPFAGLYRLAREQGIPPNWLPYVESNDVDATARQATALGGRVLLGPADVPGAGRFAVLQDPQGAAIGIYKSAGPSTNAFDGLPVLGRFSWHELMTTDATKAAEFYRALFDWDKNAEMDMGDGAMYHMFGKGQRMYSGMYDRPADMAGIPPFWLCYINVKDVAAAVATATKAGGTLHRAPMEIPGGMIAILGDPSGAAFAFHQVGVAVPEAGPADKAKAAIGNAASKVATTMNKTVAAVRKAAKKQAKKTAKLMPRLKAKRTAVVRKVKAKMKAARVKVKAKVASRAKAKVTSRAKAKAQPRAKSKVMARVKSKARTTMKTVARKSRPKRKSAAARKPASRARKGGRARR